MSAELTTTPLIRTWFGGKPISTSAIDAWETKRTAKALSRFGVPVPDGGADAARTALLNAKLAMGRRGIEERLARDVAMSDAVTRALARGSGKRRRLSQVEMLVVGRFTESQLVDWYMARNEADDEAAFLAACPDHHLFRPVGVGQGQEVWETTGGSPAVSRFFITIDDLTGLVTAPDPGYSVQMAGAARLRDGTVMGGVRHQMREEDEGVRVLLTVEMPWLIGPIGPAAHRWHLAAEFSNWIRAAAHAGESRR